MRTEELQPRPSKEEAAEVVAAAAALRRLLTEVAEVVAAAEVQERPLLVRLNSSSGCFVGRFRTCCPAGMFSAMAAGKAEQLRRC